MQETNYVPTLEFHNLNTLIPYVKAPKNEKEKQRKYVILHTESFRNILH